MRGGLIVGIFLILLLLITPVNAGEQITITYLHTDVGHELQHFRYWYGQGEFDASNLGTTYTLHLNGNELISYSGDGEITGYHPDYLEFRSPAPGGKLHALFSAPMPEYNRWYTAHLSIPYISEDPVTRDVQIRIENAERILYLNGPVLFEDRRFSTDGSMKVIDLTTTKTDFTIIYITDFAADIFSTLAGLAFFTLILLGLVFYRRREIFPVVREKFGHIPRLPRPRVVIRSPIQVYEAEDGIRFTIVATGQFRAALRRIRSALGKVFFRDQKGWNFTLPRKVIGIFLLGGLFYLVYIFVHPVVMDTFHVFVPESEIAITLFAILYVAFNVLLISLLFISMPGTTRGVGGGRGIIDDYLEDAERERAEDEARGEAFSQKYPRLSRVPVIGTTIRWMYAQSWIYMVLLLVIVLVGFGLRVKDLGASNFYEDEYQHISTAYGFLLTGEFVRYNFMTESFGGIYDRAWPFTWKIAESIRWFGFSEWAARIPSLIFGTILIPLSYGFGRFVTDRKIVGLLLAVVVAFSGSMINLSQYARMYVVFLPVFILLSYLVFKGLEGQCPWQLEKIPVLRWIVHHFDFDYRYLIVAGVFFAYSYLIHENTLLIGMGVFLFAIIMAASAREQKYINLSGLILSMLVVIIIGYLLGLGGIFRKLNWIDLFASTKMAYFDYLFNYPLGMIISGFLLAILLLFIIRTKNRALLYYFTLTLTALVFFAFYSARYASFMYISNYTVIAWMLLLSALAILSYILLSFCQSTRKSPTWEIVFSVIIVIALITPVMGSQGISPLVFFEEYSSSRPDFNVGYAELNKNYQTGDLLMGQYLRHIYISIPGEVTFESLRNNRRYSYEEFIHTITQYDRIWVTWEARKSYHIRSDIKDFIDSHFEQVSGIGVDESRVQVYLWDKGKEELTPLTSGEWIDTAISHTPDQISITFSEDRVSHFPLALKNTGNESVSVDISIPDEFSTIIGVSRSDLLLKSGEEAVLHLYFRDHNKRYNYIYGKITLIVSIEGSDAIHLIQIPFEAKHVAMIDMD